MATAEVLEAETGAEEVVEAEVVPVVDSEGLFRFQFSTSYIASRRGKRPGDRMGGPASKRDNGAPNFSADIDMNSF